MFNHEPVSKDLMRQMNRSLVLNCIRLDGPISRSQIARQSGLSAATVSGLTAELIDEGLVFEQEAGDSSGGRRPVLLSLKADGGFVIGVKLMENHLIAALTNLEANIVQDINLPFSQNEPESIIDAIASAASKLLSRAGVSREKCYGLGVGLAGIVDQETGVLRHSPIFGWQGLPIAEMISEAVGVPVFIDNDVNTVTLTEKWFGIAQDLDHFLMVTIGRGVGMGIVVNGRLYRGRGGAGEFGHMVIDPEGPRCSCGNRGCLETYVADPSLLREARSVLGEADAPASVDALHGLAERGDLAARRIYAIAGEMLGRSLANLINLFDPQMIILSGEGVRSRQFIVPGMLASVQAHKMPGMGEQVRIHVDELEDLAWARGAAGLVLRTVFESPIFKSAADQILIPHA
jgi:predicted NBD/HSP70 family sugar kinase